MWKRWPKQWEITLSNAADASVKSAYIERAVLSSVKETAIDHDTTVRDGPVNTDTDVQVLIARRRALKDDVVMTAQEKQRHRVELGKELKKVIRKRWMKRLEKY